jgi:hypothetical protein
VELSVGLLAACSLPVVCIGMGFKLRCGLWVDGWCTGTLRIRFSVLWKDMQSALTALAVTYPAICWPVVLKYLRVAAADGM